MSRLFDISKLFAIAYVQKTRIEYSHIIDCFELLRMLDYHVDFNIFELRRIIIPGCITSLLRFAFYYNHNLGFTSFYGSNDIIKIQSSKWFYINTFLKHALSFDNSPITAEGLQLLVDNHIQSRNSDIEPFRETAETYVDLAKLAYKCNKILLAIRLLNYSAQNIISYGYHKDMYLYNIIKAIDVCAIGGSKKTFNYLKEIAPYIHTVADFTDGDETGSFIHDLAELYKKFNLKWMYGLFASSVKKKEYYAADSFFSDIVSVASLPNKINEALLRTVHDQKSYNTLKSRCENEKEARAILKEVQSVLGEMDYQKNDNITAYKSKKSRKPNYSKVLPANIKSHLSRIKSKENLKKEYLQHNYLNEWFGYWLTKKNGQRLESYFAVKEIVESNMREFPAEILKNLYSIAIEVDRDFAFKCLVWYHANNNIWGDFWSKGLDESRSMWQTALDVFPDRIDEYFKQTIFFTGSYYDSGESYFLPLPKAAAFFVDSKNLSSAEKLLEAAILLMKELTPGITLTLPSYIERVNAIDEFDILLIRLTWLNPVVRERSANEIAGILAKDNDGIYHKKVLVWLSNQHIESIVVIGLVVLLKALEYPRNKSLIHLKSQNLVDLISVRCTTLYILIDLIYQQLGLNFPIWDFDTSVYLEVKEIMENKAFKTTNMVA